MRVAYRWQEMEERESGAGGGLCLERCGSVV